MVAKPLIGTLKYSQVASFLFASIETAKVSLEVREVDNQQKHHIHIADTDGNIRLVEHDQLYLFSAEWRELVLQIHKAI